MACCALILYANPDKACVKGAAGCTQAICYNAVCANMSNQTLAHADDTYLAVFSCLYA